MTDNAPSNSPLRRRPKNDTGADTYARYRYQALLAFELCLDCALHRTIDRIVMEHHSDILVHSGRTWRFIEIKTRDEHLGPWKLGDVLASRAIDQLWRSFQENRSLDAYYEVFLEGTHVPRDDLHSACNDGRASESLRERVGNHLRTKAEKAENSDFDEASLRRFLARLRIRSGNPRRQVITAVSLQQLHRAFPECEYDALEAIHERVVARFDQAIASKLEAPTWRPLLVLGDDADTVELEVAGKIVHYEDLAMAFAPLRTLANSSVTSEEMRSFFERLRCVGLDRCVVFRPEDLAAEEMDDFCIATQVMRESDFEVLLDRHDVQRPVSDEDPDYLFPTHQSLLFDKLRRVPIEPLDHALRRDRNVVIRGEPGEGKSTGLWLYASSRYRAWEARLAAMRGVRCDTVGDDLRVPLVLPLNAVPEAQQSTASLIELAVAHAMNAVSLDSARQSAVKDWLMQKWKLGCVELLLDALDELPKGREDWLREQITQLRGTRIIITTRPSADAHALNLNEVERLRLVCFGPNKASQFVHRFFSTLPSGHERAKDLLRRLDQATSVRSLAQIPLLLAILCDAETSRQLGEFPRSRSKLLELGIRRMMVRGARKRKDDPDDRSRERAKWAALAVIAVLHLAESPLPLVQDDCLDALRDATSTDPTGVLSGYNAQDLWRELVSDGLLCKRGEEHYSITLRSFHELVAARAIADRLEGLAPPAWRTLVLGRAASWGRSDWRDFQPAVALGWREIWILLAGTLEHPEPLLDAFDSLRSDSEDIDRSRSVLLAHALAEASERAENDSMHNELVHSCRDALLEYLLRGTVTEAGRMELGRALGVLPEGLGIDALIRVLADSERTKAEREIAAEALGVAGGPAARKALITMAQADDPVLEPIRGVCVVALGRVGGEDAAQTVRGLWQEWTPQRVRIACLVTLVDLADPASLDLLVELIHDDEAAHDLRGMALQELALRGRDEGVVWAHAMLKRPLRESLSPDAPHWDLCEACAAALGELRDYEAIPLLCDLALQDNTPNKVLAECLESLGEIGNEAARQALLRMPTDGARGRLTAIALGHLGEPAITESLARALEGSNRQPSFRLPIVRAVAGIDTTAAEVALLARLTSADETCVDVRGEVLRALGIRRGDKKRWHARVAAARSLQHDPEPRIRLEASLFLARYDSLDSATTRNTIQSLCEAIEGHELGNQIRARAVGVLAFFDNDQARATIAEEAFGEDAWIKRHATQAASVHARRFGWRLLRDGNWCRP